MNRMLAILALGLFAISPAFATGISDNFESYAVGSFPSPTWHDVGSVSPDLGQTVPTANIVSTTDAFGNPTQALSIVDQVASSRGIFAPVPVSAMYSLSADIRVDRYSDHPAGLAPEADWPMELTFAEVSSSNFAGATSGGIYASSLTGTWRLFVLGSFATDIDLGAPADLNTWYNVTLDFDALTDTFHSHIVDIKTGTVVVNRSDTIVGLSPADTKYDSIAFFGGEVDPNTTVADLATVDNVNISAVGSVPEPASLLLLVSGLGGLFTLRRTKPASH